MQYKTDKHKIHKHKHRWIYAQWNGPSVTKPNPENCKNCSSKCAYDCAQLQYTIQYRTVLIIFPLPPDNHHSSDVVYRRRMGPQSVTTSSIIYCIAARWSERHLLSAVLALSNINHNDRDGQTDRQTDRQTES